MKGIAEMAKSKDKDVKTNAMREYLKRIILALKSIHTSVMNL